MAAQFNSHLIISLPGCSTWTLVIFAVRGLGHPEHLTC